MVQSVNMDHEDKDLDWSIIGSEVRKLRGTEWEKCKVLRKRGIFMYRRGVYVKTQKGMYGNKTYYYYYY